MNKLSLFLILLIPLFACRNSSQPEFDARLSDQLDKLIEQEDYFRFRAVLNAQEDELSEPHALYYRAIADQVFNQPERSNQSIAMLIEDSEELNDTLLQELYNIKLQNHIYLNEYRKAEETNMFIRENYRSLLDSSELGDLRNTWKIWKALRDVPPQEVTRNRDFTIPLYKDKVGLSNITVGFDSTEVNMVFDTGANFSVISRSYVDKLGLRLIPASFDVGALTGALINSDLAVAEQLDIGGLTYNNVVFLVFDDEDLSIPQVDYHITGIIGFPVIEAMDEIHLHKDDTLFIPQHANPYTYGNLALDGLTPVVAVEYSRDTLNFHLDTGAPNTSLFAPFYRKYKKEIEANREKTVFKTGGAGGVVEFEGYIVDSLHLKIGPVTARLDSLQTHIEDIAGQESYFHGNLGQDYIRQFGTMILSFKHASILFED
ncbi:pepsin/retropepsin-like aspartic protease family protein [Sinomicrobium sp.]